MAAPLNTSLGLGITFPALASLAVCARFWARRQKKMKLWWDDYLILPGLVFAIGSAVCLNLATALGGLGASLDAQGRSVSASLLPTFSKIRYAHTVTHPLALSFPKLSIIMLYQRIFVGKWFHRATWIMLLINLGWGVAFTLVYLFQCQPVSAGWTPALGANHPTCIKAVPFNNAYGASTIILDVLIIMMPWPIIWGLKTSKSQKVAVTGIFLLAGVVTGVSIGKLRAMVDLGQAIVHNHDISCTADELAQADEGPLFYWTIPESSLAVVSACLPTLRPLFHGLSFESFIGSIRRCLSVHSLTGKASSWVRSKLDDHSSVGGLPSENSSTSIKKITKDTDVLGHSEDLELGLWYQSEVDPTKQAWRWTLEEPKTVTKSPNWVQQDH